MLDLSSRTSKRVFQAVASSRSGQVQLQGFRLPFVSLPRTICGDCRESHSEVQKFMRLQSADIAIASLQGQKSTLHRYLLPEARAAYLGHVVLVHLPHLPPRTPERCLAFSLSLCRGSYFSCLRRCPLTASWSFGSSCCHSRLSLPAGCI